jgi:capsular polysaccharide export protein
LADTLRTPARKVVKVNFNGGDDHYFSGPDVVRFTEPMTSWPDFFVGLLDRHAVDAVVLFGQMRDMHRHAIDLAKARGVTVYVFEEGYIRPDYVTLEVGGVNAESSMPRDAAFYLAQDVAPLPAPEPTHQEFGRVVGIAATYGWACWQGRARYPHYVHHRNMNPVAEPLRWIRGTYWRKWYCHWKERAVLPMLTTPANSGRYFLVPLQVYNDSQIRCHSKFMDVAEFIAHVIESFAQHAPKNKLLVLKHHPMDRAYNNYDFMIRELAREWGVTDRVIYIHDQHLPTLLRHACGVVTINSTTGLQSLFHGTPIITLGECFYAIPGLVSQLELSEFWHNPGRVDRKLFMKFRNYLIHSTQLNASFYADTPGLDFHAQPSKRAVSAADPLLTEAQNSACSTSTFPTLK